MKIRVKKILILLAAMAAFTLAATSCTQPFARPDITYRDLEQGGKVPQVSGFIGSDNINEKLVDMFAPYATPAYAACEASENALKVEYTLSKQKSMNPFSPEYLIEMKISNQNGTSLTVTSASLSGLSKLSISEVSDSDLGWLSSDDDIMTSLKLKELGMERSPSDIHSTPRDLFAYEIFIKTYEDAVGHPVDISDVKICEANGETYQKALVLEFMTYYENNNYEYSDFFSNWDQLDMTRCLLDHVMTDRFGFHSDTITSNELIELIQLYIDVISLSESNEDWLSFGNIDMLAIADEAKLSGKDITRRDAAELIWKINKQAPAFGEKFNDKYLIGKDVCSNIWARRVITYELMHYYGGSTIFATDQPMSYVNAVENSWTFVNKKMQSMLYNAEYANAHPDSGSIDKYTIVQQAELILNYFKYWEETHGGDEFEIKEVINDRDYDWYYNQNNTGAYSSVNCMPSIATMAAHWYNKNSKATVQKMRNTSDVEEGWTVYELRNGLDHFNIPYTSADANLSSIMSALDEGKIVLAQYSDRPFEYSGHCYVIYGYRQYRNTVIFIVNDSDPLVYRAQLYGRPAGCGMELDADFSMWSIERFVSDVTIIG